MGYSPWGRKESDTTEQLSMLAHSLPGSQHTRICTSSPCLGEFSASCSQTCIPNSTAQTTLQVIPRENVLMVRSQHPCALQAPGRPSHETSCDDGGFWVSSRRVNELGESPWRGMTLAFNGPFCCTRTEDRVGWGSTCSFAFCLPFPGDQLHL